MPPATSAFDKETFLATHVEGQMETSWTPYPEDEYEGFIDDVDASVVKDQPVLNLSIAFTDEKAKKFMDRDKPTHTETVFLDFEDDGRLALGKNKNVKLGAFREAAGQNTGKAWNPQMLRGAGPMLFKIAHRYNKQTGDGPFAYVARVARAGRGRAQAA